MAFIPAGEFYMGWEPEDPAENWGENATPLHLVYLNDYCIDFLETTNGAFAKVVEAGHCTAPQTDYSHNLQTYFGVTGYETYPLVGVAWEQAAEYCARRGKRLPTEAQWEKAARGPAADQQLYPWGAEPEEAIPAYPSPLDGNVGSFPSGESPYCVHNMAGSAPEHVGDWFSNDYYSNSAWENPTGPEKGTGHVVRGGTGCAPGIYPAKIPEAYMIVNRYDCSQSAQINLIGLRRATQTEK